MTDKKTTFTDSEGRPTKPAVKGKRNKVKGE